jgi:WD40 repeat protein
VLLRAATKRGGRASPPHPRGIHAAAAASAARAEPQVDGATVIWDLKKQRPVITLKDPNSQRRCSVLQWNPEVATQLVVASDDDRSPTLQLWDLRNSMGPVKEFVGHTKGVLGMAWSAQDPGLLLSCSKDCRTVCWEVATTDTLCELPASGNWDFDVQVGRGAPGARGGPARGPWLAERPQPLLRGRARQRRQ